VSARNHFYSQEASNPSLILKRHRLVIRVPNSETLFLTSPSLDLWGPPWGEELATADGAYELANCSQTISCKILRGSPRPRLWPRLEICYA
ncbi:unnamed protein product, partial [Arabidopsis halleri]